MVNDSLSSGGIRFTGLGSGTDFDSIIDQLIEVEGAQKKKLEQWKSTWEAKVDKFDELNTKLLSLESSLKTIDSVNEFLTKTATSTDPSTVTATAESDAIEASYNMQVTQLARNDIDYSSASVAEPTDVFVSNAGTFEFTYGSDTISVNVPENATLQTVVNLINADAENNGKVRAETLKIGEDDHRLKLVGLDLGDQFEITISSGTSIGSLGPGTFTESQDAQDALLTVDGINFTRQSNFITDVIAGVNLTLKDETAPGSSVEISVNTDIDGIKENVNTFVTQVNEVRKMLHDITQVDTTNNEGSILTGNYGVDIIEQNLKTIIADKPPGFDWDDDAYSTLAQIGLVTVAEEGPNLGLLEIDDERLSEALSNDPNAVARLFASKLDGTTTSGDFIYSSSIDNTTRSGEYAVEYTISGGSITSASIDGQPAKFDNSTGQITSINGNSRGLVLEVTNPADGTYTGDARLRTGVTSLLIEEIGELTDEVNRDTVTLENGEVITIDTGGTLPLLEKNYEDIIKNIEKKIDYENARLNMKERRLRDQFARLEETLTNYDGIQNSLNTQLAQLSSE